MDSHPKQKLRNMAVKNPFLTKSKPPFIRRLPSSPAAVRTAVVIDVAKQLSPAWTILRAQAEVWLRKRNHQSWGKYGGVPHTGCAVLYWTCLSLVGLPCIWTCLSVCYAGLLFTNRQLCWFACLCASSCLLCHWNRSQAVSCATVAAR